MEDYTGVRCQFCPDGHAKAQALIDQYGDNVVVLGVNAGFFPAYITKVHTNDESKADGKPATATYDLEYDDGDKEEKVDERYIRFIRTIGEPKHVEEYAQGDSAGSNADRSDGSAVVSGGSGDVGGGGDSGGRR